MAHHVSLMADPKFAVAYLSRGDHIYCGDCVSSGWHGDAQPITVTAEEKETCVDCGKIIGEPISKES